MLPVKHIPNTITLLNLLAGCLSIVSAFEGNLMMAGCLIALAAIFDFLDGFLARLLKAYSPLGKELDSLADLVSFGVAPSVIVFWLLRKSLAIPVAEGFSTGHPILALPFLIAAFSALRLAIFNLDTRQATSFIGLPTPANALLVVGIVMGLHSSYAEIFQTVFSSPRVLVAIIVALSALLVSPIPMFSLKVRSLSLAGSWRPLMLLLVGLALILLMGRAALLPIMLFYIASSIVIWPFAKAMGKKIL